MLGQQLVQGIDYAYTLQGWLKGVNSDTLVDPNGSLTAIDAYRFSLNYFNGDYTAIGSSVKDLIFPGHSAGLPDEQDYRPLFNGNISSMVVGIPKLGETRLYNYGYDQLNRLTKMDAYTGYNTATHSWAALDDHDGEYKERISYDGNGNILTYLRNGRQGELEMDNLSYHYNRDGNGNLKNNKLTRVEDDPGYTNHYAATIGDHTADIDDQPQDNYDYDPIGNLVKDSAEHIRAITWTVYGKIKAITKTDGTKINYTYDAGGNRISKSVISGTDTTTTWYVRDAQGNPMGIYSGHYGLLTLDEHHLYGSSRLGIWNRNLDMLTPPDPNNGTFARGDKFFELTDHRGNVLVTVSDRKFGHDGGGGIIDYYTADVVNANDYYSFGMLQPGRKFNAGSLYRYGFNGKENDNEVKGEGNSQDYGMRIYDPRVGRFLSVDPLAKTYPWYTPYQFAGNKPIWATDIDGGEEYFYTAKWDKQTGITQITFDRAVYKKSFLGMSWTPSYEINLKFEESDGETTNWTFSKLGTLVRGSGPGGIDLYQNKTEDFWKYKATVGDAKYASEDEAFRALDQQFFSDGVVIINRIGSAARDFHDHGGAYTLNAKINNTTTAANSGNNVAAKDNESASTSEWKGPVDYTSLPEPRNVGPGKKFTPTQKAAAIALNKQQNGGVIRDDETGEILNAPKQDKRGIPTDMKSAQLDHNNPRNPKDKTKTPGTNSNSNIKIRSKGGNIKKSNN